MYGIQLTLPSSTFAISQGAVVTDVGHTWAVVLAAGEGSRLRSLTTTACGLAVPKQFCSLRGGQSLLDDTLQRAHCVAAPEHTCVIVASQHEHWWSRALHTMPRRNVIVQPANRGTANGILLSLLHILDRDPDAKVVFLPSDHHVGDEMVLQGSLREAVKRLSDHAGEVLLLGLQPDEVDPELGYIVPGEIDGVLHRVGRFVEKPSTELAARLTATGALWNAFIVVAHARALAGIFERLFPRETAEMRAAVASDAVCTVEPTATTRLYERLRDADFSRHVLEIVPQSLRVLTVPACGWSDLGTPARVGRTLSRTPTRAVASDGAVTAHLVNLAEQFMRGSELQSI